MKQKLKAEMRELADRLLDDPQDGVYDIGRCAKFDCDAIRLAELVREFLGDDAAARVKSWNDGLKALTPYAQRPKPRS